MLFSVKKAEIDISKHLRMRPSCVISDATTTAYEQESCLATSAMYDCSDLRAASDSGVYTLLGNITSRPLSEKCVYCDMDTERGG